MKETEKQVSKSIGLFEQLGCACLNLGCLVIILSTLGLFGLVLKIVSNPIAALIWLVKEAITSVVSWIF